MKLRSNLVAALLVLALGLVSVPAAAETYGGSGEVDGVDVASQTINVGEYTIVVTAASVMLDETGSAMTITDLNYINGSVSFTMKKKGTRWELVKLVVEEEEEDEEDY